MYVSRYAMLLVAAIAVVAGCTSRGDRDEPRQPASSAEPEVSADLEPFLTSYFATWSAGDMDGYRDHFLPEATVYLVKSGRVLWSLTRDPFVDGQADVRASSAHPGVERMTGFEAHEDRQAATVTAQWELVQGEERTVGVDRFTLIRDERWRWKIVALLFYGTE